MQGKEIAEKISVEQNYRTAREDVREAINAVDSALVDSKTAGAGGATEALEAARDRLVEAEDAIESDLDDITTVYSVERFKLRINEVPADSPHNMYDIRVEVTSAETGQRHTFDCRVKDPPEDESEMPPKVTAIKPSGSHSEDGGTPDERRCQRARAMLTAYDVLSGREGYAMSSIEDVCVRPDPA
jgi:hypothetical protein